MVIKAAALSIFGTIAALIVKKGSAEMAIALALAVCAGISFAAFVLWGPIKELFERAREFSGLSWSVLLPVLRCVGISIFTRLASNICRDGGQSAISGAVELAGAVGALYAALPLFNSLLDMLEELT